MYTKTYVTFCTNKKPPYVIGLQKAQVPRSDTFANVAFSLLKFKKGKRMLTATSVCLHLL